jgi:hypothetical protein
MTQKNNDWVADNLSMHTKFGVHEVISTFNADKLSAFLKFRLDFLQEEIDEAKAAYQKLQMDGDITSKDVAAEDIVDAMIDLCVVAIGTLNALQVNPYDAWNSVHEANMAKEVGIKASRPNPLGLPDLIKPASWTAPSHADNIGILPRIYS